jgi:hypothetical protein
VPPLPLPLPHALISALTSSRIATLDASIRSDPSASEAVASSGHRRAGGMQLRSLHVKFEAHLVLGCDRSIRTTMGIGRSSLDFGKGKKSIEPDCIRQFFAGHYKPVERL